MFNVRIAMSAPLSRKNLPENLPPDDILNYLTTTLGDSLFLSKQLTALTGAPTTQLQEKVAELNEQGRSPAHSSFLKTGN